MVPVNGPPPSSGVTWRRPVPASSTSTGLAASSWLIATLEVCPP